MFSVQPKDVEGSIIQGSLNQIPYIINVSCPAGKWTEIIMSASECKQFVLQSRDRIDWQLSTVSGGTQFFTFYGGAALQANAVLPNNTVIGWVNPSSSTTMELLIGI